MKGKEEIRFVTKGGIPIVGAGCLVLKLYYGRKGVRDEHKGKDGCSELYINSEAYI